MVDLIIESFKIRKTVYDEGLQALSGLIFGVGKDFAANMEKFFPYLIFSLRNNEDTTLCRVAVGCVGDLSRALEDGMAPYLNEVVPILMNMLRNPDTDRSLKLVSITALGDLAFATHRMFIGYLHDLLEILKSAAALSLQPIQDVLFIHRLL